jgi:hypothetical protein
VVFAYGPMMYTSFLPASRLHTRTGHGVTGAGRLCVFAWLWLTCGAFFVGFVQRRCMKANGAGEKKHRGCDWSLLRLLALGWTVTNRCCHFRAARRGLVAIVLIKDWFTKNIRVVQRVFVFGVGARGRGRVAVIVCCCCTGLGRAGHGADTPRADFVEFVAQR